MLILFINGLNPNTVTQNEFNKYLITPDGTLANSPIIN